MKPPLPRLLLITDSTVCADLPPAVAAALEGGVRHVLLREKGMAAAELTALARELRRLTTAQGACLLIHDRLDLALAVAADGIHLPDNGLETAEVRRLWPQGLVGRSCHSVESARRAGQAGADFVTLSPLFATLSHPGQPPLGATRFAALRANIPGPVLALGGIHAGNAAEAMGTGADGIALIRGILNAPDPRRAAETLVRLHDLVTCAR